MKDINILFETELLAVDKGLDMLLDANGKITMEEINWMREPDYGELKLIPINPQDTTGYRFPRALLLRNSEVTLEGNDEHRIKLEFEAVYNENELMMEKIAVSDGDRINLNIPLSIDSVDFERAMTYYIADKLNMTVDTDIFRGEVPVNIDGCAVTLEGQDIKNSTINQKFEIKFICIDSNRDKVMKTVNDLTEKFPVYGENISLSGQDIGVKAILKDSSKFDWEITDDGKMKTLGSLTLLAII